MTDKIYVLLRNTYSIVEVERAVGEVEDRESLEYDTESRFRDLEL